MVFLLWALGLEVTAYGLLVDARCTVKALRSRILCSVLMVKPVSRALAHAAAPRARNARSKKWCGNGISNAMDAALPLFSQAHQPHPPAGEKLHKHHVLKITRVNSILNISTYKFVPLPDAAALRELLLQRANALQLKGTILLAEEGINLFLAGPEWYVRGFIAQLQGDARFADIVPKESWSDTQPFKKMLVKVKREIIRMDHPTIRPALGRAPAVSPTTVKRWLDQGHDDAGRPVVTLDTRND